MSAKPVCLACGLFFTPHKCGITWEEGMPQGRDPVRYTDPDTGREWSSYKLWRGDVWRCRGCGTEIIYGHGLQPVAIQHQPDYEKERQLAGGDSIPFVHDC